MNTGTIRVLIVDDEPIARDILETYIARIPGLELIASCKNALEAFQVLNKQKVDLLLLDINMPEITGISFLNTLKDPPHVIFTTAYSEYALESYDHNAVDYLLKPISFERFLKGIHKAIDLIGGNNTTTEKNSTPVESDNLMFIKAEGKLIKIDLKQLWFAEGLKDYIRLWTEQGKIVIHSTMKNFEDSLSKYSNFIRVHKSFIVNLEYIEEIDGNLIRIRKQEIAIGSTYKDEVYNMLNRYKLL